MTHPRALRIALASIAFARRGVGGVAGERALKRWDELEEAKLVLRQRSYFEDILD